MMNMLRGKTVEGEEEPMRASFCTRTSIVHMLVLFLVATQTGAATGGTSAKAVLSGDKVRVQADLVDGRLRER
jgi:hypothetical protein